MNNYDRKKVQLDRFQDQLVRGTLLGTSSLIRCQKSKNCHLVMRQNWHREKLWLEYKAMELKSCARPRAFQQDVSGLVWTSFSHSFWTKLHGELYCDGKKKVTMDWLDKLQDIALAVWFGDTGLVMEDKSIALRVSGDLDNAQIANRYFQEVGMECHSDNKMIRFTLGGSQRFLATTSHCLPPLMLEKLEKLM